MGIGTSFLKYSNISLYCWNNVSLLELCYLCPIWTYILVFMSLNSDSDCILICIAFACRWVGDWFESRPKLRHYDVKSFTYCCYSWCMALIIRAVWFPWAKTDNSCKFKTFRQRLCNQRIGCMQLLKFSAFQPFS